MFSVRISDLSVENLADHFSNTRRIARYSSRDYVSAELVLCTCFI